MTAQECVLDLLRYIGVTGFTAVENDQKLNRPGLDDDDTRRALGALNSGLQTIQKWGPQNLKQGERAAFFNDPTTLTLSAVVHNGQGATCSVVPPSWILGCSILLSGDSDLNRIMDITGAGLSLLRGYRGPTGATIATVYADCALLSPEIAAVVKPVYGSQDWNGLTRNRELRPADDLTEFNWWQRNENVPGRLIGIPGLYIVERRRGGDLFLRVTAMPASSFNATFQAKLRAERITEAVLDTSGVSDPGYEFTSLAEDEVESLLLPIARWRFFTHPALKNAETRQAVKMEYDEVMAALKSGTTFESSVKTEHAEYI